MQFGVSGSAQSENRSIDAKSIQRTPSWCACLAAIRIDWLVNNKVNNKKLIPTWGRLQIFMYNDSFYSQVRIVWEPKILFCSEWEVCDSFSYLEWHIIHHLFVNLYICIVRLNKVLKMILYKVKYKFTRLVNLKSV